MLQSRGVGMIEGVIITNIWLGIMKQSWFDKLPRSVRRYITNKANNWGK